jgi:hypothetical protein
MNWPLILVLSLFGILMGLLSLFGLTHGIEWILWLIIAVISAAVLAKKVQTRLFVSGFLVGVCDGVFNSIIQSLFFGTYLLNNPQVAEQIDQIPAGIDGRFFSLLAGPFIGLIFGLVVGLLAVIARKVTNKRSAEPTG